jgi:Fe-Mn family superoxide dismutase
MAYDPKNYDHLKGGTLKGLSDSQLDQHFTLYKGYVAKLNEIEEKLGAIDNTKPNYSFNEYSELKRREAVAKALEAAGGKDKVLADLKSCALGGPGWALLTRSRRDGKLHTYFVAEHHIGLPVDQDLLIVLDSWEHAFMVDYGIKRPDYLGAFLENIKWSEVSKRFAAAIR